MSVRNGIVTPRMIMAAANKFKMNTPNIVESFHDAIQAAIEASNEFDLDAMNNEDIVRRSRGWIITPPGYIPIPRTVEEARRMMATCEGYIKVQERKG